MKVCALILVSATVVCAQTVTVEGDVAIAMTRTPIEGAQVSIMSGVGSDIPSTQSCVSEASGHFKASFAAPMAWWVITISRAGFIGKTIAVRNKPGENPPPTRVFLNAENVISGRVEDADGVPAEGTRVEAQRYTLVKGRRILAGPSAVTDSLGEYRIALTPGSWYVRAVPSGRLMQADSRYGIEYYGGTQEPSDDMRVSVATDQDRHGIDFRLTRREGVSISGRIATPDGLPGARRMQVIRLERVDDPLANDRRALPDRDGGFLFRHVPSGVWILRASSGTGPLKGGDLYADQRIQVADADVIDLIVSPNVAEPRDIAGMVTFESHLKPRPVMIGLRRHASDAPVWASTNDDGSFTLKGVLPGHYDLEVQPTTTDSLAGVSPGYPVAVHFGDHEVPHMGIDVDSAPVGPLSITLGSAHSIVEGRLLNKDGQPLAGVALILVGDWCRFRKVTNQNGSFRWADLLPGEYNIVLDTNQGNMSDYGSAERADFPQFRVTEGENPPQVLTLSSGSAEEIEPRATINK